MKLFIVGLMLLCLYASPSNSCVCKREISRVSHKADNVKGTLKSVTGNWESHTQQAFQENTMKAIAMLTNRIPEIDGSKTQLNEMDKQISKIERLIAQRDEIERTQMQDTTDTLEDLEGRLGGWLGYIENKVSSSVMERLSDTEARLAGQVAKLKIDIQAMASTTKDNAAKQADTILTAYNKGRDIGARIEDIESALDVLKGNLDKIQENNKKSMVDVKAVIQEQRLMLNRVKELLEDTSKGIRELPKVSEVRTLHNETRVSLQETKHTLEDVIHRGMDGVGNKVSESKEEAKDLCVSALRLDLANSAERVIKKLNNLEKIQSVMVSMTDHVLDTRNKVEDGVQQILLGVGDLMKAQGTSLNNTLTQKFDGISNDIMNNQEGALASLTTNMEQKTNQILRQIKVMYQQMMESAKALEKLHEQNEAYVNGTTMAMGSMESKVGDITKRMREVDENLNYHLKRLSLVTQEFNQIKSGLNAVLNNMEASVKNIQEKANDLSTPGPATKVDEARFSKTLPDENVQVISHIFNTTSN